MQDKDSNKHTRQWVALRLTALAAIPLCLWLVYSIVNLVTVDYETFVVWLRQPLNILLLCAFLGVTLYHAAIGSHEIIEDYVPDEEQRSFALRIKILLFVAAAAACGGSIAKIVFFP